MSFRPTGANLDRIFALGMRDGWFAYSEIETRDIAWGQLVIDSDTNKAFATSIWGDGVL